MKQGFSLIEVTIFVAILSVFFVMVVAMSTSSLASLKTTERRAYATRYAEELVEWLSGEGEIDWNTTFLAKAPTTSPTRYCFNGTLTTWPPQGACPDYSLDGLFKREVALSRVANVTPGDFQVNATVTVSWQQGSGIMSVPIATVFNKNE
jgi:Tfp pilus assembly protein PilV